MPSGTPSHERAGNGIAAQMQRIADGFGTLVRDHLALARIEAVEDAKSLGGDVARVAVFAPFLLLGYALLCVAASVAIGQALGMAWGFVIVAGVNLLVGGVGVGLGLSRLRQRRVLGETVAEIKATSSLLSATRSAKSEGAHGR